MSNNTNWHILYRSVAFIKWTKIGKSHVCHSLSELFNDYCYYLISYHGSYCNDESYIMMWWLTGLLETFQNNNALLDQIQKCLEAYLESKRVLFARWVHLSLHFYHLSIQILTSFTFCSHWFIILKSFKKKEVMLYTFFEFSCIIYGKNNQYILDNTLILFQNKLRTGCCVNFDTCTVVFC